MRSRTRVVTAAAVLALATTPATRAADPAPADVREALRQAAHVHLANPSGQDLSHWVIGRW